MSKRMYVLRRLCVMCGLAVLFILLSAAPRFLPRTHTPRQGGSPCTHSLRAITSEEVAPVTVAVSESLINTLTTPFIPVIEAQQNNMVVPAQKLKYGEIEVMRLRDYKMQAMQLTLAPSGAHNMSVTVVNMSLTIPPTNFTLHVFPLTCRGQLWASMNETTITFSLGLHRLVNGTLQAVVDNAVVSWGHMTFNHTLDTKVCSAAQSVVEAFMGDVNEYAVKSVKEQLQDMLPSTIANNTNDGLSQLPFAFIDEPSVTAERLSLTFSLTPISDFNLHLADADPPHRDLVFSTPATSPQRYLDYLDSVGRLGFSVLAPPSVNTSLLAGLFPTVTALCPDCPLGLSATTRDATGARTRLSFAASEEGVITLSLTNWYFNLFMLANDTQKAARLRHQLRSASPKTAVLTPQQHPAWHLMQPDMRNHFSSWHPLRRWGRLQEELQVSLLLLSVNATGSVGGLSFVGSLNNKLCYTLGPLHDLALVVRQSLIGDIDGASLTSDVDSLMNNVLLPLLNLDSPLSLSYMVEHGVIRVSQDELWVAADVYPPYF